MLCYALPILALLATNLPELKANGGDSMCGDASTYIRALPKTPDYIDGSEPFIPPMQQELIRCNTLITAQPFYKVVDFPNAEERLETFFNLGDGELDIRRIGGFQVAPNPNEFHAYDRPRYRCAS
eukprot:9500517-Pyramimonas_sp.AAC.1